MGDWSESTTASDNTEYLGRESKVESEVGANKKHRAFFCPRGVFFLLTTPLMGDPVSPNSPPKKLKMVLFKGILSSY